MIESIEGGSQDHVYEDTHCVQDQGHEDTGLGQDHVQEDAHPMAVIDAMILQKTLVTKRL